MQNPSAIKRRVVPCLTAAEERRPCAFVRGSRLRCLHQEGLQAETRFVCLRRAKPRPLPHCQKKNSAGTKCSTKGISRQHRTHQMDGPGVAGLATSAVPDFGGGKTQQGVAVAIGVGPAEIAAKAVFPREIDGRPDRRRGRAGHRARRGGHV